MATRRDARFKASRRFGLNIYGHPKALNGNRKSSGNAKCRNTACSSWKNRKSKLFTICWSVSSIVTSRAKWKASG